MFGPDNRLVGIRRRFHDNSKRALKGSRNGLFIPKRFWDTSSPLFITEGESDCMAVCQMGLQVIGRPGNMQCKEMITEFMKNKGFSQAILIADNDSAGEKGAKDLTRYLIFEGGIEVKIIRPPKPYKDFREWFNAGVKLCEIADLVEIAQYHIGVEIAQYHNIIKMRIKGNTNE